MAYKCIPSITQEDNAYVVSELSGSIEKDNLQKRIKILFICLGKPLECLYYKDWSAD